MTARTEDPLAVLQALAAAAGLLSPAPKGAMKRGTRAAWHALLNDPVVIDEMLIPRFAPEPVWHAISGMKSSRTYTELASGNLRGKKLGKKLLIDVPHGLKWLEVYQTRRFACRSLAPRDRPADE
jgi:hypothetical protein